MQCIYAIAPLKSLFLGCKSSVFYAHVGFPFFFPGVSDPAVVQIGMNLTIICHPIEINGNKDLQIQNPV